MAVCGFCTPVLRKALLSTTANSSRILKCSLGIFLPTPAHTEALGAELAKHAQHGDVILLHGDLGGGKTSLARGYIRQARQDIDLEVTSPTYLLDNYYPDEENDDGIHIHHMDLWRLKDVQERTAFIDFERVFANDVSLIEWPDRLGEKLTPAERLDIYFNYASPVESSTSPMENGSVTSNDGGDDDNDNDEFFEEESSDAGRYANIAPRGSAWECRIEKLRKRTALSTSPGREKDRVLSLGT